jgi:hypothetical protein
MKSFAVHKYRSYLVWIENCKGRTLKEGNGSDNRKNIQLAKKKKWQRWFRFWTEEFCVFENYLNFVQKM